MSSVTDLTYLDKFCAGNKEKMQKYIDIYLKSTPAVRDKIAKGLSESDFVEVANQVHGCKTKFTMMGMNKAFELAHIIENQCRSGEINEQLKNEISELLEIIPQSETELRNHK
jgi:HPt (histidine-containing phosphotransfer) domain-containing protein